jgi:predicted S18 family serine protease
MAIRETIRHQRGHNRLKLLTACLAVGAAAIAATDSFMLIHGPERWGQASEITVGGKDTNVYRLTVVEGSVLPLAGGGDAAVSSNDYQGDITADQQKSLDIGWDAACSTWGQFGVLGVDTTLACAVSTGRPKVSFAGTTQGPSAGLSTALAFADWHFDITGGHKVAATGAVSTNVLHRPDGTAVVMSEVSAIGGVPEKAEAAAKAHVELLLVPTENYQEFARQPVLAQAGVELVGVSSVPVAVHQVCKLSRTEVCLRVLTAE